MKTPEDNRQERYVAARAPQALGSGMRALSADRTIERGRAAPQRDSYRRRTSAMASLLRDFRGGCHCGALGYSFRTALPVAQWSVRACQCRFCRAHGALTTSDPDGRLTFLVNQMQALQRYRFGLKTADFILCSRCGVYLGAQIETAPGAVGIINTCAITPLPEDLPAARPADYDSESSSERVTRRQKRWTPLDKVI
jgi:hypothetical protein